LNTQTTSTSTGESCAKSRSSEVRSNAAILIQSSVRRLFATKVTAAKKAAKQEAESIRLQQNSYSRNRSARVNSILEKIKARELHHSPYQLGHLYTIHEE